MLCIHYNYATVTVRRCDNVIHCIYKVIPHRARLVLGWVSVFGQVCNQPTKSTEPCIPQL